MATVFLAHQLGLSRKVALKIVHAASDDAEDRGAFQERFRLEAKTLASLSHPHIVTVYDYGETEDGDCFIAMEYVEGPRFAQLLKKGPLESPRAVELVLQVCRALRYSHANGVIHRDIKLSNVLIGQDEHDEEHVKVVDFGLVKITGAEQKLTSHGIVLGSPHFMAPEQVRGDELDHRADIYSLGILLYCSLTGRYPLHGASRTATMTAHLARDAPPFSELVPERSYPPGLEDVVLKTLRKDPDDRHPDMEALISELMPFAMGPTDLPSMGVSASFDTMEQQQSLPQDSAPRLGQLALVAVVSFAVGLAIVYGIWSALALPESGSVNATTESPRVLPVPPSPVVEEAAEEVPPSTTEETQEETPPTNKTRSTSRQGPRSSGQESSRSRQTRSTSTSSKPVTVTSTESDPEPAAQPVEDTREESQVGTEASSEALEETTPAEESRVATEAEEESSSPPSDIADPWASGANPAEPSLEPEPEEPWKQAGNDLKNPWDD